MRYRAFGRTGMRVSEVGFGGWAIGGNSFGEVADSESLAALARAEELGCNFVDTAAVYGRSESILGAFLRGRRDRWIVATKYSGQPAGMRATLEAQLRLLRTDFVDFYQLHWVPDRSQYPLYEELERLKESGMVRSTGVSLYSSHDIDFVLDETRVDGFQICMSLLNPLPFLDRLTRIQQSGSAVIVRSVLHNGFLTGKYDRFARFTDANDQRSQWSASRIRETAFMAERFRFLENDGKGLLNAAIGYPLTFSCVSTVILSTKSADQASVNFADASGTPLSSTAMQSIGKAQRELGLFAKGWKNRLHGVRRRLASFVGQ